MGHVVATSRAVRHSALGESAAIIARFLLNVDFSMSNIFASRAGWSGPSTMAAPSTLGALRAS